MSNLESAKQAIESNLANKKTWSLNTLEKIVFNQIKKIKYGKLKICYKNNEFIFGNDNFNLEGIIKIKNPSFFYDVLTRGSIGAAESYVQKNWESPDLVNIIRLFTINRELLGSMESGLVNLVKPLRAFKYWSQKNSKVGSKKNIEAHYDLPDKVFEIFLDKTMMYSSAIFQTPESSLEEAQLNKINTIAKKLNIKEGQNILEIGTGWGALAIFLAQNYNCHVTTTTISENQYNITLNKIKEAGLEDKITLLKEDYRNLTGKFDRIVSIEMIEAVGEKYLPEYLTKISHLLTKDGLVLLQAITINDQEYQRAVKEVDFIKKYIFPGSFIPSIHAILEQTKNCTDLRINSQYDFAGDYALTIEHWRDQFNKNFHELTKIGFKEDFNRLWNFYFCYCIGGFKERAIGVSHLVFGKPFYRG